jgi:hypothetical protein
VPAVALLLLLAAGLALSGASGRGRALALRAGRRRGRAPGAAPALAGPAPMAAPSPGGTWRAAGSAVVLSDELAAALDELAAAVGGELVVTSGYRSPGAQARAMLRKVEEGGAEELRIYGDRAAVAALLTLPREEAAWTAQIAAWADAGRYLSRHQTGKALDLRTRDVDPARVRLMEATARALGWRTLLEATPPHLHLQR